MSAIPILMYHSVDTDCAPNYRRWMISPDRFRRQMAAISEWGYEALTMSALADSLTTKRPLPEKAVVITFDDGFHDFLDGALPILEEFGLAATLFVVAGHVGGRAPWLNTLGEGDREMLGWGDLAELPERGIEIGAHTLTHPQLDILSEEMAESEIRDSKKLLEDRLGFDVRSFAYPHGYAKRSTRAIVKDAGFSSACSVRHAISSTDENIYGLSRIIVTENYGDDELRANLQGKNLPVAPEINELAVQSWRLARRLQRTVQLFA